MFLFKKSVSDQPPRLEEAVPYVTNVYQYMTNKKLFLERVALQNNNWASGHHFVGKHSQRARSCNAVSGQ
ncbi:unnamed protein product [Clonostachys rosea f. rosea IK726]|uniref:Uncharacterized protein n=1 Tax=Clonostachys rosea f. rosea IK726 TaxID=1349383 RepID=A0ACA9UW50_BIOOC|nr:unnamed protein product [Clonostachys rosea f. rosea IK726]